MAYHENREYPTELPVTAVRFRNMNFLAHWHSEVEFVLVIEGQLTIGVNNGCSVLEAGDMAMFSGGSIHYYDSSVQESTALIIVFRPEIIEGIVDLSADSGSTNIIIQRAALERAGVSVFGLSEMRLCFEAIINELNGQKAEYKTLVKAKLVELAGLFRRCQPPPADNTLDSRTGNVKLLQKAIRYINENYARDISLDDISDYLKISPFYFSRIFSKSTGLTFKSYVNKYRIEKAQKMILNTTQPIIEIAYDCGFSSIRTFNRVFRDVCGRTPSDLRRLQMPQPGTPVIVNRHARM